MNQQQAAALMAYLQRSFGVIPTTGAEWQLVSGAISLIESIANGLVTVEVKPVGAPLVEVAPTPAPPAKATAKLKG